MTIRCILNKKVILIHSHKVLLQYIKMYCGGNLVKEADILAAKYVKELMRDRKIQFTTTKNQVVVFEIID